MNINHILAIIEWTIKMEIRHSDRMDFHLSEIFPNNSADGDWYL